MWRFFWVVGLCLAQNSIYFNDDILYQLNVESNAVLNEEKISPEKLIPIVTYDNERLRCTLPVVETESKNKMESYVGPTPEDLVTGIYTDKTCLLRIELYWSYEMCHGRYLRQFHEEKETKSVTEFYLGNYVDNNNDKSFDPLNPPKREFNGKVQAYYPVQYKHGQACDLTGEPRTTTVFYICSEGLNVFYSLNEISTCVYEAVVGIAELCVHPMYKINTPIENPIRCFADPYVKVPEPKALRHFQAEVSRRPMLPVKVGQGPLTQKMPKQALVDDIYKMFQTQQNNKDDMKKFEDVKRLLEKALKKQPLQNKANNPLADFWTGKSCLYGGNGWWKHEFCFGHSISQVHEENGKTTKIVLGYFDRKIHKEWVDAAPNRGRKMTDGEVTSISLFYSRGDICKETNSLRSCEVRLTCRREVEAGDTNKITMYLFEPETCNYVLVVESILFCETLETADQYGFVSITTPNDEEEEPAEVTEFEFNDGKIIKFNLEFQDESAEEAPETPKKKEKQPGKHNEL